MPSRPANRRVLVVTHDAGRSGAPTVGGELARTFDAAGWDTHLVCRWWTDGPGPLAEAADRVTREPLALVRVGLQRVDALRPAAHAVARRAIRTLLQRERPDLVWCNSVMTAEYAMVATELGIPSVLHSHERPDDVAAALGNTGFATAGITASPLITYVACATGTAEVFANELGVERSEVEVLHSTVDLDEVIAVAATTPPPDVAAPLVVACGSGNPTKGIDVFCAAAAASRAAGDPTTWVWVGDVPPEQRHEAVHFPGVAPSAAPWLAAADVVVVPSRFEQLSLVVIEAMALGRPVVASDVSGPRELLDDTGVLVPPGDAAALRAAVDGLLADPVRSMELGARAALRCRERWDLPRFRRRAVEIAEQAVLAAPATPR